MPLSGNLALARAVGVAAHPLRLHLLELFTRGPVETAAEAALMLGESLPNVRHHLRVLHREQFLAPLSSDDATGNIEGRYQATDRANVLVDALSSLA
jgi:hypothetical protein